MERRPPAKEAVILAVTFLASMTLGAAVLAHFGTAWTRSFSEDEAGFDAEPLGEPEPVDPYAGWTRPDGIWRVGLQAGHWNVAEVPEELENLKGNTGAIGGGKREWEVNLDIAERAKTLLEAEGVLVDLLPATIPPEYWADAFVAVHADGNPNPEVSGYKVAAPRRDRSGHAARLLTLLEGTYGEATDLQRDPNVTRNMRGYYAFNWRKYEHSLHPMTPAVILETGFLTSPRDRRVIVADPDRSARALADAVLAFLQETVPQGRPS